MRRYEVLTDTTLTALKGSIVCLTDRQAENLVGRIKAVPEAKKKPTGKKED